MSEGQLGNPQDTKAAGAEKTFCYGPLPKAEGGDQKYAMEITINSGKVSKLTTNIPK